MPLFRRKVRGSSATEPGLDLVVPLVRADLNREEQTPDARADWVMPPDHPSTPVIDFLVGSLIVLYAFDLGNRLVMATHRDLERLRIEQVVLADAARHNVEGRLSDLQFIEAGRGYGMLRLDGNLEASVMLVPDPWRAIAERLGDDIVVAVPARDVVFYCARSTPDKTPMIEARDRVLAGGDHTVTKDVFRRVADSWEVDHI